MNCEKSHFCSLQASRACGSPHRAHTKYSHESPFRLDEFWQRPAVTPLQSPQVSNSGRVWTFGFSTSSLFTPSSCLTASEGCKETRGLSRNTARVSDFSFVPQIPALTSFMFLFLTDCAWVTGLFVGYNVFVSRPVGYFELSRSK